MGGSQDDQSLPQAAENCRVVSLSTPALSVFPALGFISEFPSPSLSSRGFLQGSRLVLYQSFPSPSLFLKRIPARQQVQVCSLVPSEPSSPKVTDPLISGPSKGFSWNKLPHLDKVTQTLPVVGYQPLQDEEEFALNPGCMPISLFS